MFLKERVVIGDGERGLVFRDRRFERVLTPGVYRFYDPLGRMEIGIHNVAKPEFTGTDVDSLIASLGDRLGEHFVLGDIGTDEVGLVSKNGKLEDVLLPGTRKLYWRAMVRIEIERIALEEGLPVRADIARRLRQLGALSRVAAVADVATEFAGLMFVDGKFVRLLPPGSYAFWNFQKNIAIETVDQRMQAIDVAGQELLSRDKVTLRVNLAATIRVVDPVAARTRVAKFADQVYRELQFGLRKSVSARTLDELLGDKAALDTEIFATVRDKVAAFGVELLGVGIKDVILPGEMREILNSVVQAEKSAQANVIRRREEANAARSLLNTAKLIEDNPTLMRLKELEALEKVTEKIDKLTVFGGLDGVLKQLVTLKT